MKTRTTAEWVDKLEALKIGCGPINTLREVFARYASHVLCRVARVNISRMST
jgi:crotonobetainyl-CoA:carnitine CoA-transferase CaiB-like acyl-CoA transferase